MCRIAVFLLLLSTIQCTWGIFNPDSFNYCSITSRHTACSQRQKYGPACNGNVLSHGLSSKEKKDVLDLHNHFRSKVSRGHGTGGLTGTLPKASNMMKLEWDDELAHVAQRHADQCIFEHDCADCRSVSRFSTGQNLYIYKQTQRSAPIDWGKATEAWYDEIMYFSRKNINPFRFKTIYGHLTAMLWATTFKMGCGMSEYREGKWFSRLYTCNYGPTGNIRRRSMYKIGQECSACPKGTGCSKVIPGLCEKLPVNGRDPFRTKNTKFAPRTPSVVTRFQPIILPQRNQLIRKPSRNNKMSMFTRLISNDIGRNLVDNDHKSSFQKRLLKFSPQKFTRNSSKKFNRIRYGSKLRTRSSSSRSNELLRCNFNSGQGQRNKQCRLRANSRGVHKWKMMRGGKSIGAKNYNYYYQRRMSRNGILIFALKDLIDQPKNGKICITLRYKMQSTGILPVSIDIRIKPLMTKYGSAKITKIAHTWVRAHVDFKNVYKPFYFYIVGKSASDGSVALSIDDILITSNKCPVV